MFNNSLFITNLAYELLEKIVPCDLSFGVVNRLIGACGITIFGGS